MPSSPVVVRRTTITRCSLVFATAAALSLTVGLASSPAAHAQSTAEAAPLTRLMSPAELQRTGVARLSVAERRALERWLATYTRIVALGAQAGGASGTAPGGARGELVTSESGGDVEFAVGPSISPVPEGAGRGAPPLGISDPATGRVLVPAAAARTPAASDVGLVTAVTAVPRVRAWQRPERATVLNVAVDGSTVRLGDGSVWAIAPVDRAAVLAWRGGDRVALADRPGGFGGGDVLLGNAVRDTQVTARLLVVPSPLPGLSPDATRP